MKILALLICILINLPLFAQSELAEVYGFRHLQTLFKGDTVDILIKSKKGEEHKKKPLFLFCQGSLPIPLVIQYNNNGKKGIYHVFVFNPDSLSNEYHLAIINKPGIPMIVATESLNPDLTVHDSSGKFPQKYVDRNLLDYYAARDIAVIKFLRKQTWVSDHALVVAGHSEGSTVAAKIAMDFRKVTRLIYCGGNPFGRILSILEQLRSQESDKAPETERMMKAWQNIVDSAANMSVGRGDTYKATYQFSIPPMNYLTRLKIPVLVSYGTKDVSCPFNDYFRVEMIRQKRTHFTFKAYIGVEHNFFPVKEDGKPDFDIFNWDKVADDWRKWLNMQTE